MKDNIQSTWNGIIDVNSEKGEINPFLIQNSTDSKLIFNIFNYFGDNGRMGFDREIGRDIYDKSLPVEIVHKIWKFFIEQYDPNKNQEISRWFPFHKTMAEAVTSLEIDIPNFKINNKSEKESYLDTIHNCYKIITKKFYEDYISRMLNSIAKLKKHQLASQDMILPNTTGTDSEDIASVYNKAIKKLLSLNFQINANNIHISYDDLRILMPLSIYKKLKKHGHKYFGLEEQKRVQTKNYFTDYYDGIIPIVVIEDKKLQEASFLNIKQTDKGYSEVIPNSLENKKLKSSGGAQKDTNLNKDWLGFIALDKSFTTFVQPYKCFTNKKIAKCIMVEQSLDGQRSEIQDLILNSLIKFVSS